MTGLLETRIEAIDSNRNYSKPLSTAVAPAVSSNQFRVNKKSWKPWSRNWDSHFSIEGLSRTGSTLKNVSSTPAKRDVISLGTARPDSRYYPWMEAAFKSPTLTGSSHSFMSDQAASTIVTKQSEGFNLALSLNYGFAAGSAHVLRFITEHIELLHNPPNEDWETCLTCGTTSAIDILFRIFLNRGDPLIVEEYTYSGTIGAAKALGLELISISMDGDGLSARDLERVLEQRSATSFKMPSVVYTIPCGHNPTGTTQSLRRRQEIYQIAEKYDLIIIEDDPYHLLQLGSMSSGDEPGNLNGYKNQLPRSYLSLDTSGRVVRLETASKILAPGLRCGWLTADSQIVKKFLDHTDASTGSVSGPSQVMLFSLLDQTWGHRGFLRWLSYLSTEYSMRRDKLMASCSMHLPPEICSWSIPTEGMFLWIQLQMPQHSKGRTEERTTAESMEDILSIEDKIYTISKAGGVMVSKGSWFKTSKSHGTNQFYFRLTFAAAPVEFFDGAVKIFGDAIREVLTMI